jgi:hypothetical protein
MQAFETLQQRKGVGLNKLRRGEPILRGHTSSF